jgi:beta-lactamase regulating signal transducer with metallopeptidase domain
MFFSLLNGWMALVLDVAPKSLLLFLFAGTTLLLMRRASAAWRHHLWRMVFLSLFLLPILSALLPQWRLSVRTLPPLPTQAETPQTHVPPSHAAIDPDSTRAPSVPGSAHAVPMPIAAHPAPSQPASSVVGKPESQPTTAPPGALRAAGAGDLIAGIFAVWLIGSLLLILKLVRGLVRLKQWERRCQPVREPAVTALASRLVARFGLRNSLRLLSAPNRTEPMLPMTWGISSPVLLLPCGFPDWPEERQRAVLLHELAHIERGDWLVPLLAGLACALYWVHPLVWLAAGRLRLESERACDDRVLSMGVKATDYARQLLEVLQAMKRSHSLSDPAVSMAHPSQIADRMHAILDIRCSRAGLSRPLAALALTVFLGLLVPLSAARVSARREGTPPSPAHLRSALIAPALHTVPPVMRTVSAQETVSKSPRHAPAAVKPHKQQRMDAELERLLADLKRLNAALAEQSSRSAGSASGRQQWKAIEIQRQKLSEEIASLESRYPPLHREPAPPKAGTQRTDAYRQERMDIETQIQHLQVEARLAQETEALVREAYNAGGATLIKMAEAQAKTAHTRIDLEAAQRKLKALEAGFRSGASGPSSALQRRLTELRIEEQKLETEHNRYRELMERGFVSAAFLQESEARLQSIKAEIEALKEQLRAGP